MYIHPTYSRSAGCSSSNILIMLKTNIKDVVQRGKALTGQNKSTEGQRALIEAYKAISDLLSETPAAAWNAWVMLGRRTAGKEVQYINI